MAEEFSPAEDGAKPKEAVPPIIVNAQYTKDLSFEAPGAPNVFGKLQIFSVIFHRLKYFLRCFQTNFQLLLKFYSHLSCRLLELKLVL